MTADDYETPEIRELLSQWRDRTSKEFKGPVHIDRPTVEDTAWATFRLVCDGTEANRNRPRLGEVVVKLPGFSCDRPYTVEITRKSEDPEPQDVVGGADSERNP